MTVFSPKDFMTLLHKIEVKWQKAWEKARIFEVDPHPNCEKCFVTFPYSYANGPLHVGHAFTATRVDAYARYKRMQGYNVLFPWAWHWTGQSILGASERVKLGDKAFIKALREIDGVPENELNKLVDPEYMASYYTSENRVTAKRAGFSIDWRREFNTTSLRFSKFIEWQYKRLLEKGFVVKGTHPVVWCPQCESPTGDHDRQEGEGVTPEEYVLIKFRFGDVQLPAATFRPETIFGATNIWINPDANYVEAEVDRERWIISDETSKKLAEQKRKIKIIRNFRGRNLIGRTVSNPITGQNHIILPAQFVDATHATGVVYSVPAHAPFDWLALKDLKQSQTSLKEYGIKPEDVEEIQPISIIEVEGYGEFPASEVIKALGVKDQCDPKAEEATKLLYKKEFHGGVLKDICGDYAGKRVKDVKDELINNFKEVNAADTMYDLPQPVTCRCLTNCIVKVLEEQWFLKYNDPQWKEKAKFALQRSIVYPETAIPWFQSTIDWLREWPCARKSGLGTQLPWNKEWIIETLSDSTVYMAFYTIVKQIRQHNIAPEQLTPTVFDFIFYGKNRAEVETQSKIDMKILESIRSEFLYWYPVDMRNSAKELIPNHLTFFLFHHAALFPPEHWPRVIGANGMLMVNGKKMSKSKGNWATFRNAIEEYGADSTRCALLLGAEGLDDPDWRSENVGDVRDKLRSLYRLVEKIEGEVQDEVGQVEKWLLTVLQKKISIVTDSLESLKTRTALEMALFEIWNDFRWYLRRKDKINGKTLQGCLSIWIRLLSPFAPHICEELWERIEGEGFITLAEWPKYNVDLVDLSAEESEALIKSVLEDAQSIIRTIKLTPTKICFYVAAHWKWRVYQQALEMLQEKTSISQGDLIKALISNSEMKNRVNEIQRLCSKITDEVNHMEKSMRERLMSIGRLDEKTILQGAIEFLEKELKAEVEVFYEDDSRRFDPENRARLAKPYRPAIFIR
jgi:leucyl-tRNA synthetase